MFAGPGGWARHHDADTAICVFSESVSREVNRENPNGWVTKPYDPAHWSSYWDHIIFHNVVEPGEQHPDYRGPGDFAIIQWSLTQRRKDGLPDLFELPRSGVAVSKLYATISEGTDSVDSWIQERKLSCWQPGAAP
jgi:hypothetical protein